MSELYNKFHEHFEVVSADTVGLMEKAFRIRYQVYCVEKSYETAEAYPDGMEIDEYDMHSTHSLVKCQRSGDTQASSGWFCRIRWMSIHHYR